MSIRNKKKNLFEENLLIEAAIINKSPDFTIACGDNCISIFTVDGFQLFEDGEALLVNFPFSNDILNAYHGHNHSIYCPYKKDVILNLLRMCRGFHADRRLPFENAMFENMVHAAWHMGICVQVFYRLKMAMRDRRLMTLAKKCHAEDRAILLFDGWIYNKEPKEKEE